MRVREVMSKHPVYLRPNSTVKEAAEKMEKLDCGFIPVGDGERLLGMVTDRDITLRAVAKGKDPSKTYLKEIMTPKVLYVYDEDDVERAAESMEKQRVRRLVVLDRNKNLNGIVSLGDLATKCHNHELCGTIIEDVSEKGH